MLRPLGLWTRPLAWGDIARLLGAIEGTRLDRAWREIRPVTFVTTLSDPDHRVFAVRELSF